MSSPYDPRTFVAFDVETHLIQDGLLAPPLVCGSVSSAIYPRGRIGCASEARTWFWQILNEEPGQTIVGANIAYDMLVMAQDFAKRGIDILPDIFRAYDEGRVFDVQIAEALHAVAEGTLGVDPNTGKPVKRYSLDACVNIVLGRDNAKENDFWRLRYALLEDKPIDDWPEEARQYPLDDAVNTLEVALAQVERNRNLHELPRQCRAAWVLHLGAAWGFRVDNARLEELEARVSAARAEGLGRFQQAGFVRSDESVDQSVLKRLILDAYGSKGVCFECDGTGKVPSEKTGKPVNHKPCDGTGMVPGPTTPRTEKGGISKARDTLLESGDELLEEYGRYTEEAKLHTTYIPFLRKGSEVPINLRPNPVLATGRVSYSDVVQLLPRSMGVREALVPRPGYYFFACDYSGGELVTHAQSCLLLGLSSQLADALNEGLDAHSLFGADMLGIAYEAFIAEKKGKYAGYRQAAKAANFGLPGGMGVATFVLAKRKEDFKTGDYQGIRFCILIGGESICGAKKVTEYRGQTIPPTCERCLEEAEKLRNHWFRQWPENRAYFALVAKQLEGKSEITQHVTNRVRGDVGFTQAANGYFQGLLADVMKDAHYRIAREAYTDRSSPLWGARPILMAHDELIGEAPVATAAEAADRVSELMVEVFREYCPDLARACKAEPALMERWYKGAETVRDSSGRLQPWRP